TTFAIRESWHPRWTIAIDGHRATVRRLSPDILGVDVGPGEHHLVARFERPLWCWLLWLLVPLCIAVEPVARAVRRRLRRAAAPAAPATP
ncbi:MAG TPA: hypothetical protein VHE35_28630, partial [Kofleriaceae bacterium]|nr:hypothetical protein [Kofleriaceae bacterium]